MREQDDDAGKELEAEAAGLVQPDGHDDIWTPLRKMRHSAAHVMAEAVLGLSSRTRSSPSARRSRMASITTSTCLAH